MVGVVAAMLLLVEEEANSVCVFDDRLDVDIVVFWMVMMLLDDEDEDDVVAHAWCGVVNDRGDHGDPHGDPHGDHHGDHHGDRGDAVDAVDEEKGKKEE